ncbi:MAG: MFS transporter [Thermodesulfobacteriota bacterium]
MTRTERTYYVVVALWNLPGWFMHPVYPMFLLSRGLDLFEISAILAIFQISVFLFEVPTGAVADLYGRKVSFLLSCVVRMAAFLLYSVAPGFLVCAIAEVIDAIGVTLASGAIDAWAVDGVRAEGDRRPADRMFARSQAIVRAVMVVGGVVCGYLADRFGLALPWLVAAGFFACAFVFGLLQMYDDRGERRAMVRVSQRSLAATVGAGLTAVRDHPVLRMLCVLSLLSASAMMPVIMLWPPHVEALAGTGYWVLGWVWALLNVAAVGGALLVPALLRRLRREWLLVVLALWPALFLAAAALSTSLRPLLGFLLLYEMAQAARHPVVTAWLNEHVGTELRATVISVQGMSFMLGGALGLVGVGLLADRLGIPPAWLVCAALFVVIAPLNLVLGRIARENGLEPRLAASGG